MKKVNIPEEELSRLYKDEEMSIREIADYYEFSIGLIHKKMKKYKIERRNEGRSKGCEGTMNTPKLYGKENPNYKDGRSYGKYGHDWVSQRRKTLERDNYTCRWCGKTRKRFNDGELHVHHINANLQEDETKDNSLENLMTLCKDCHYLIEHNKVI